MMVCTSRIQTQSSKDNSITIKLCLNDIFHLITFIHIDNCFGSVTYYQNNNNTREQSCHCLISSDHDLYNEFMGHKFRFYLTFDDTLLCKMF